MCVPLQSKLATKTPNKLQRLIGLMLLYRVAAKVIKTCLNEDGNGWTEKKQHYLGSEPADKYFKQDGEPSAKNKNIRKMFKSSAKAVVAAHRRATKANVLPSPLIPRPSPLVSLGHPHLKFAITAPKY